jgi:ferredoxin
MHATLTIHLDGETFSAIQVASGQTFLDAAIDAGIDIPFVCRQGSCGSCMAHLVSGEARLSGAFPALSKRDREAGMILACQATAASDSVTITYDF